MSTMSPQPCMGGWCSLRGHCPHYTSAKREDPLERLCVPGHDGVAPSEFGGVAQVDVVMPPAYWARLEASRALQEA